jgi:hypothetical protein
MMTIAHRRLIAGKQPIAFGHTTRRDPIAIGPTKYDTEITGGLMASATHGFHWPS